MTSLDLCSHVSSDSCDRTVCALQSMENLYAASGQGADGGQYRSDLQDMGKDSVCLSVPNKKPTQSPPISPGPLSVFL